MLIIEYRTVCWWYWLLTACLLTIGVAGYYIGFMLAIGFTIVQLAHYLIRERNLAAFPVQARLWYLALLLIALAEVLNPIYWLPTVGTWALVLFGYCGMARFVSLLPWNRRQPLSLHQIRRTFFARPVCVSIQDAPAAAES